MQKLEFIGADWLDVYVGPDSGMPLLGAVSNYVDIDDAAAMKLLHVRSPQLVRQLVEWEVRIQNGDTKGFVRFYDDFPKACRAFCLMARIAVLCALLTKNLDLFRRVYMDMDRFSSSWPNAYGQMAVEGFMNWLKQLCFISDGYAEWMERYDWTTIPVEWRYQVGYVGVRMMLVKGRYEAALAAATVFQLFNRAESGNDNVSILMAQVCASACRELGRTEEMHFWHRKAAELAAPRGMFLPFLSYFQGNGSPIVNVLSDIAPAILKKINEFDDIFYESLILVRNFLTGEDFTTLLSRREFYIARCLKRDMSYKEIADRVGISVGRTRNIISDIYSKLNIHSRTGLDGKVW